MKKCLLCNGSGYFKIPSKLQKNIKALRKKGLTMRQIAKIVGVVVSVVHYHLNKKI